MSGLASQSLPHCFESNLEVMNLAIVSQAQNGAAAFRGLYELHKSMYRHMSFGYIMRRTGITSKGYLSHVMNGDRRLNARYQNALCDLFKLSNDSRQVIRELWLRDDSKQRDRRAAMNAAQYPRTAQAALSAAI